ncbi:putative defense protein 2 isoform X2 [Ostrea edulis]|uniref:putative defense protein 2 isoform X2 n=1 Tax=Ostrea edulis TaxID=37623 RepID=UPI0024AF17FB|nr:putative defense protein 2 isoform X2 [Ostrea edulis]
MLYLHVSPRGVNPATPMLSLLVSLSLLSVGVYCYPNGAPTGSCGSMIPGHNAAVQTGASPYRVTMNTTSYDAGDVIEVTVSGGTYRGVFVQARPANCSTVTFPTFSLMSEETNLQTLSCNGVANSAITHTNKNDKTQSVFYWSPAANLGHVYFRATFVQTFNTYWVGIVSPVLRDSSSSDPVPNPICQNGGNNGSNGGETLKSTLSSIAIILAALLFTV